MGARRVVAEELDRAETVGKMDGQNRNEQHDNHGRRGERQKSPAENEHAANDLDNDRRPAEEKSEWHADRVQDCDESSGPRASLA